MKPFEKGQALSIFIVTGIILMIFHGCAGVGKRLETPEVTLAHITMEQAKGFEAVYQLDLRVFNTNDVALEVRGIDCELEINGKRFAKGVSAAQTTVPAYGTELVQMKVYSSMLEMMTSLVDMVRQVQAKQAVPKLEYKLAGRLRLGGASMMPGSFPFSYAGELNLQEITRHKIAP